MSNSLFPVTMLAQTAPTGGPSVQGLPDSPAVSPGTTQAPGVAPTGAAPASNPMTTLMLPLIVVFGLMILMQFWTSRKEQKKKQELMNSMKKGDRVQTLGGIIGTVQDVYEQEVVIRLEEGRMRVSRASVQTILKTSEGRSTGPAEVEVKGGREKAAV